MNANAVSDTAVRAVFADFDGVFHPSTAILGLDMPALAFQGREAFTRMGLFRWVQLLEDALASSPDDIMLIVHSSWRKQPWASSRVMRDVLGPLGHRYQGMTSPEME